MAKIIRVSPKQWASHMTELAERFMPAMQRGVAAGAMRCIPILQRSTRYAPPASPRGMPGAFDTGRYLAAWKSAPIHMGAKVFNTSAQSGVIEGGRRPSPVSREGRRNLEAWARRKLKLSPEEAKSAAWAIAQELRSRPLEARKVMNSVMDEMTDAVMAEITHELDLELGR